MTRALRGGLLAACAIMIVVQGLAVPVTAGGHSSGPSPGASGAVNADPAAADSSGFDTAAVNQRAMQTASKSLSNGKLTLTGRVQYRSNDGSGLKPARQVRVSVRAIGGVRNEQIATTTTDDSGRYSVTVDVAEEEVDFDFDEKLKVRIITYASNPAATVHDAKTKWPWDGELAGVSTTRTWTVGQQSATVDFEATGQRHRRYFQIADWMLDGYRFTEREAGWTRRQIDVRYFPEQSENFQFQAPLDRIVVSGYENWDSYDMKGVILHEYGHAVMDGLYGYGGWQIPEYKGMSHCSYSETGQYYAFNEGFAKFFSAAVAGDPDARGHDLEIAHWYRDGGTHPNDDCPEGDADGSYDGAKVEGAVASVLWDVYDPANEPHDEIDGSLKPIFDAMRERDNPNLGRVFNGGRTSDLHDFFLQYVQRTDRHEELRRIYFEYGIVKPDRFDAPAGDSDDAFSQCLVYRYPCSRMADHDWTRLRPNASVHAGLYGGDEDAYVVSADADKQVTVTLRLTNGDTKLDLAAYGGAPPFGESVPAPVGHLNRSEDVSTLRFSPDSSGQYTINVDERPGHDENATYRLAVNVTDQSSVDIDYDDVTVGVDDDLVLDDSLGTDGFNGTDNLPTYCEIYPEDCASDGTNGTDSDSDRSTDGESDSSSNSDTGSSSDSDRGGSEGADDGGSNSAADGDDGSESADFSDEPEATDDTATESASEDSSADGSESDPAARTDDERANETGSTGQSTNADEGAAGSGPGFQVVGSAVALLAFAGLLVRQLLD